MGKKNIVICSGGTGGHLFPAQATVDSLLLYYNNKEVSTPKNNINIKFFTDKRTKGYLKNFNNKSTITTILTLPFSGKSKIYKIKAVFFIWLGFLQTLSYFIFSRPKVVVAFGGYVSVPVLLSAVFLRIPIILHEQNAILGKANRLFIKFAKIMATNFHNTIGVEKYLNKVKNIGMPIRKEIFNSNSNNTIINANPYNCSTKNENNNKFVIAILGGSQGAKIFGSFIPETLKKLPLEWQNKLMVYHQCRKELLEKAVIEWQKTNIKFIIQPFFHNISSVLKEANLIISRAGASSIAEINYMGKPALYIPFKRAILNHQEYNAKEMVKKNCAELLLEDNLNSYNFNAIILQFLNNQEKITQMGILAKKESFSNSDYLLTSLIIQIAEK